LRKKDVRWSTNQVKAMALWPASGGDGKVSLIRQIIGDDRAKASAKEFIHGNDFLAFGCASHQRLQPHCESIEDDPSPFLGHANLALGYPTPSAAEAATLMMTEERAVAQDRLRALSEQLRVVPDPDPGADAWLGAPLAGLH